MGLDLQVVGNYCELSKTNLKFKKEVTQEQWMDVFKSLKTMEGCVQFWIGDCLKYREQKWGMYDDIAEETGYDKGTLKNIKMVSDAIKPSFRNDDLSFSHHMQVAPLTPAKQEKYLAKAVENDWSVRELRQEIKEHETKKNIIELPIPEGKYSIIVIDPPWPYGTEYDKDSRRVASPYPELSISELEKMVMPAADNASLWLWTTHRFLWDAKHLMDLWGFEYKATVVWNKEKMGMGAWFRMQCEFCLVGIKGHPKWNLTNQRDILSVPRGEHSVKPMEFYKMVEGITEGKKLDIFARGKKTGWSVYGNELGEQN